MTRKNLLVKKFDLNKIMDEKRFVIRESQIQAILKQLGECKQKHVNIPVAILVNLPELDCGDKAEEKLIEG